VLILFLPMASLLVLDTYENQLLAFQEHSMIQQGRIFASALSGFGEGELAAEALRILENLRGRTDSRIRVVDTRGRLLADSAVLTPPGAMETPEEAGETKKAAPEISEDSGQAGPAGPADAPNASFLYHIAVYPLKVLKKILLPPAASYSGAEHYSGQRVLMGPEIEAALEGRYGAATRYSSGGQVSVNLYSAIPVSGTAPETVRGAVLVSRSSYGILLNLYRLRLDIIRIFFVSLVLSLVLSLGLSLTITGPIKKLKAEAEGVLDKAGHFSGHFKGLKRRDEIGDLSRSLHGLSQKLEKRITFIDRFTSDLLHELKNPLAAIRARAELAAASPAKEEKLLAGIAADEGRVERLLGRLRELSRIDNTLEQEPVECIDPEEFIPLFLERYGSGTIPVVFEHAARSSRSFGAGEGFAGDGVKPGIRINPDRFIQALGNPMDNALSFSPPGAVVRVGMELTGRGNAAEWRITVDDQGPGIREENAGRYFDRFYSERPDGEREQHSGLGLAIVKAIAEASGGSCSLGSKKDKEGRITGCRFTLVLPAFPG
jgi:two-component system sensor histidine kinase ChvG